MSNLDPKVVRATFAEQRDKDGRRVFVDVNTPRPNNKFLQVFASDIDSDDGDLVLMGRYLIPFPDLQVENHQLVKLNKIWVTKGQAKKILSLLGEDVKRLFKQNAGLALFSFIGKGIEKLLSLAKVVVTGPKMLILDNVARIVMDAVSDKVKKGADVKAEGVAALLRESLLDFVSKGDDVLKELAPEVDIKSYVDAAVKPFLDEIRDLFGK